MTKPSTPKDPKSTQATPSTSSRHPNSSRKARPPISDSAPKKELTAKELLTCLDDTESRIALIDDYKTLIIGYQHRLSFLNEDQNRLQTIVAQYPGFPNRDRASDSQAALSKIQRQWRSYLDEKYKKLQRNLDDAKAEDLKMFEYCKKESDKADYFVVKLNKYINQYAEQNRNCVKFNQCYYNDSKGDRPELVQSANDLACKLRARQMQPQKRP